MGQHKHNPVALAAKNGDIPPNPPKKSKREREREINEEILRAFIKCYLDKSFKRRKNGSNRL